MGFFKRLGDVFGFGAPAPAPITKPSGGDGIQAYAGFLASPERNPALVGGRKWTTYANAINMAIVATGVRYRCDLLAGAKWTCIPNPRASAKDAARGVEIVERGLLKAQMAESWSSVVRRASLYKLLGFSLHEWTLRRDADQWVFAELAHRPQSTIERWNKPSEQAPWDAIGQLTQSGFRAVIERERLFYCVDNLLTGMPDGQGLLRHVVQLVDQIDTLEGLEGHAFETDLRGTPIARVPFKEIRDAEENKQGATEPQINAAVHNRTNTVRGFLQSSIKTPEQLQFLMMDSSPYVSDDRKTFSTTPKWALELLRGDAQGLGDIDRAIRRKQIEIARVLGIEFAMVGGGDSAGSYGMHSDKTAMLGLSLKTTASDIAGFATRDLARPLVGANGLDVETCTPTLMVEPIATEAVTEVCRALQLMAQAALMPGDPARDVIRERLELPPEPEPSPALLGARRPRPGPPDPSLGEEDVDLGDLGGKPAPGAKPKRRAA